MILTLKRKIKDTKYTLGELYINNMYECDTLEDPDRGLKDSMTESEIKNKKVYGNTAIPTGTYNIDMNTVSPKFKDRTWAKFCEGKLPRLQNVKGYEGVLIHVGNKPEDTLGCILVGKKGINGTITNSTETFKRLYNKIKNSNEELMIKIE